MSTKAVGIGMIGLGTVGRSVATLLRDQACLYARRLGRPIELKRVLVRDAAKAASTGLIPAQSLTSDPEAFFATPDMPIVIEVAGGRGPVAAYVRRALQAGKHIITANKSLLAAEGPELFALAREQGASIAFEAACGGGIPCITALQFGLMANQIDGIYAILNGTCNFILTAMTRQGQTYRDALAQAQQLGFAEADPTLDISGQDAAQKLAILASLAFGVHVQEQQVSTEGIDTLQIEDLRLGAELGYDVKLLAIAQRQQEGGAISASVQPCFIHAGELLAKVEGAFNALSIHGHAVGHTFYYGAGAGGLPTASAVVSDLLNVASGWYPTAFANLHLTADRNGPARIVPSADRVSRFYLRVNGLDRPGTMAKVTAILGEAGISLSAVLQHETNVGQFVPVVITTHDARQGDVDRAVQSIRELDVIAGEPVVIRIVDLPGQVSAD